jgi:glycosyltransferase involved in cell wall biosynthesis
VDVLTTGNGTDRDGVARPLRLARPFGQAPARDRPRHLIAGLYNQLETLRYLRTHPRPDVVLVMSLRRLGLMPLRAFQQEGIPYVLTVNDDWPVAYSVGSNASARALVGRWLDETLVLGRTWKGLAPASVVYVSEAVRRAVHDAGVPLPSGVVRSQGVDLSVFNPRPFRPMRPEPRLLFVGRLHPSKAPEVALEALAALERRGHAATLTLAGEADDVSYLRSLHWRARELRVEARVTWAGKVPREHLPALYRDADALLFASRLEHEGQGLTYLEAMACGVPVVAWPSGGAREFLERHDAARLATTCTGEAFADELAALLGDREEQESLVARALGIVRAHASIDTYTRHLEDELHQAIARHGTAPLPVPEPLT